MLDELRDEWKALLASELDKMAKETVGDVQLPPVVVQTPPKPEMGDIAFPLFAFAKVFHMAPPLLAGNLKNCIEAKRAFCRGSVFEHPLRYGQHGRHLVSGDPPVKGVVRIQRDLERETHHGGV